MVRSLTLALAIVFAVSAIAQPEEEAARKRREYIRANYTKYEFQIPMRDGVKLFTSVYSPKDASVAYPILMRRTPYSIAPYGADNYPAALGPSEEMSKERFIFVYQDVRGRFLSEGEFVDLPAPKPSRKGTETDESTDAFDSIEWLLAHVPDNNGKVGIWGVSYDGTYATFALIGAHPALKAVSPQAPMADVGNGDDAYHNGAFYLAQNFNFYANVTGFQVRRTEPSKPKRAEPFDFGTTDEYEFFLEMGPLANSNERHLKSENPYWNELLRHPNYDEFWQARALATHMKGVTPAVLLVSGWYDAEDLAGPQKLFRAIERNGPKAPVTLVIGPWTHGGWQRGAGKILGNLNFASDTAQFYRENIELPFFAHHLKGKEKKQDPKAWMFETGTNQWRKFEQWPPAAAVARSLYLQGGGRLSFSPGVADAGFDEYVGDPAKPVPVTPAFGQAVPGIAPAQEHSRRRGARKSACATSSCKG